MSLDQLPVLLRREFQEHRAALLVVPFIVTAFLTLLILFALFVVEFGGEVIVHSDMETEEGEIIIEKGNGTGASLDSVVGERIMEFARAPRAEREKTLATAFGAVAQPVLLTLWIVVFFFLLGTLYDERQDRSILFWKSMPVSDTNTIVSKVLLAVLVAPAIYMVAVIVVQLVMMLSVSVTAMGYPVDVGETLWAPANMVRRWLIMAAYFLYTAIWCLPFYGWILFVSSFARSIPFVWALGVPFGIVIIERIFTLDERIGNWMGRHVPELSFGQYKQFGSIDLVARFVSIDFLISLGVGIALLYGAIWMRGRGDEL